MKQQERDFLVAKLLSGIIYFKVKGDRYKIVPPTAEQKLLAEYISMEASSKLSFQQLLSEEDAEAYLSRMGIWTEEDEKNYEQSEDMVEDLKVALFKNQYNTAAQKTIRSQLAGVKGALLTALSKKLSIAHMTLENHRRNIKNQFLVAICSLDSDGSHVYGEKEFWDSDSYLMQRAYAAWEEDIITPDQLREIARTEPWRSCWSVGQESIFSMPPASLSEKQKQAIMYSKMYDNAYQNPDCPPDEVIEDDDMFDGWMISERREREKNKKKKNLDKVTDQKGDEIFVMADSPEDADDIVDVNDYSEKMRLRDRMRQIKASEDMIEELDLRDVQMMLNRQLKNDLGQGKR